MFLFLGFIYLYLDIVGSIRQSIDYLHKNSKRRYASWMYEK